MIPPRLGVSARMLRRRLPATVGRLTPAPTAAPQNIPNGRNAQ